MSIFRFLSSTARYALVLATALLLSRAPGHTAIAREVDGLSLVPPHAAAFVHIRVRELCQNPALEGSARIPSRVEAEVKQLFESRLGLNIGELEEITLLLPTLASAGIGGGRRSQGPPGIAAFTFATAFDPDRLARTLTHGWQTKVVAGRTIRFDEKSGAGVLLISDRTFLYGSQESLSWIIQQQRRSRGDGPLSEALEQARGRAHVTVGLNATLLPPEAAAGVPDTLQPLFQATSASLLLHFGTALSAEAKLNFPTGRQAAQGQQALQSLVALGRAQLAEQAAKLQRTVNDDRQSFEEAVFQVLGLAIVRHFDATFQGVQFRREGNQVSTVLRLESADSAALVFAGLAGVQAIGRNAAATFDEVSRELEAIEHKDLTSPGTSRRSSPRFKKPG